MVHFLAVTCQIPFYENFHSSSSRPTIGNALTMLDKLTHVLMTKLTLQHNIKVFNKAGKPYISINYCGEAKKFVSHVRMASELFL
jgi:hypothetical protein